MVGEELLVLFDAETQNFRCTPDKTVLNKFGVFPRTNAVPGDILLAQRIRCIFTGKRPVGRDFFDAPFLAGGTGANLD